MPSGTIALQNSSQTSGGGYIAGTVDWEYTQDKTANTSRVVCNLFLRKQISGGSAVTIATTGNWECSLTVNGQTVSGSVYAGIAGDWVLMLSQIITVPHNDDGTKTITVSAAGWGPSGTSYSGKSAEGSGTLTLDTIPRASSFSAGGMTLGSKASVSITAAASGWRHDLYLKIGSKSKCVLYDVQGGTRSFTPTIADFAPQITSAKSATGTLTLYTFNASRSAQLGSKTASVTVTVPASCAPAVSAGWAAASYYNTGTAADGIAAWVQGYSKAQITFNNNKITTKNGASIKSYKVVCAGAAVTASPYRTQVLTGTGASIVCTVTDSRGYTASETLKVSLLPYAKPALSGLSLYRSDADGTAKSSGTCIYAKATLTYSDLGGLNACTLKAYYKAAGGAYGDGQALTSGVGAILTAAALVSQSYTAKIEAVDSLGNTAKYEVTIPTDTAALHLRAGGSGAAFGKYAEQDDLLDVAWNTRIRGKLALNELGDFVQKIFGRDYSAYQSVTSYPAAPGIYRTVGTEIFAHLAHPHGLYGVLLICKAGYAMHLYLDHVGRLFYGRSSDTYGEPEAWRLLDGIEAEGTSGIWTYRMYASGIAECWGRQTCSGEASQAWGSLYALVCDAPSYPITFAEPPVVERSLTQSTGSSCWLSGWSAESATNPGRFALLRPTTAAVSAAVSFYVRGKWK